MESPRSIAPIFAANGASPRIAWFTTRVKWITRNLNIEAELKRRTLESQARQQEAIADEAEEQAKLTRAKRIEAELELVEKFRKLGLILTEEDGEMKIEKAPEDFDSQGLTRRMIDDGSSDSEQD